MKKILFILLRLGRNYLQVGMYTKMVFPQKGVRYIAINDSVDSSQDDNDLMPLKNLFNEWMVRDTSRKINPSCHIFFATRGKAVVNDSVKKDAYAVGMDTYATIISNGDHSLGTVLHRTSKEFQEVYQNAE